MPLPFTGRSRDSVVGIQNKLRASNPAEARCFSFLQNIQTDFGAHPAYYPMGMRVLSRATVAKA